MPTLSASISASDASEAVTANPAVAAEVRCARVAGASAIIAARAGDPLKLLVPRPRGVAALVYATTYGGGLLGGDQVALSVAVGPEARLALGTQASTKIYRARGDESPACWSLDASVAAGGLLASLPDPVCCFAGARYRQRQRIALAAGASLVWLDTLTCGRSARGERWAFASVDARTSVDRAGVPLVRDGLRLEAGRGLPLRERFGDGEAIATLIVVGPLVAPLAESLLANLAATPAGGEPLVAASPLAGGAIVRIAACSPAAVTRWLRAQVAPALTPLLDHHPWDRKS